MGYLLVILLAIASIWAYDSGIDALGWIAAIVALLFLVTFEVLIRMNNFAIEDREVSYVEGILSKKIVRVHYANVSDVTVEQSFLQRVLGFGDVHISTPGTDVKEIFLHGFSWPGKIGKLITDKVHEHRRK